MKTDKSELFDSIKVKLLDVGVPEFKANLLSKILIESSEADQQSHGIGRLNLYLDKIKDGTIKPQNDIIIDSETPCIAGINANFGIGPVNLLNAFDIGISKARKNGISAIAVKNSNDIARLGTFTEYAASEGFISFLFVTDNGRNPSVAAYPSNRGFFSTNPFAFACPGFDGNCISIDISTSQQAIGKINKALKAGEKIRGEVLIDSQGKLTSEPQDFFDGKAVLLPFGGLLFGHKGFGLAMMVEIMAGLLTDSNLSSGVEEEGIQNCAFAIFLNPYNFISEIDYKNKLTEMIQKLTGIEGVRIPGFGRKNSNI